MFFTVKFAPSGEVAERKVHGEERKSVVEGVLHLIMFDQKARKFVIGEKRLPATYNSQLSEVTGEKYTLEHTDIKMVHHLLTDPLNHALWFPKNCSEAEAKEREKVISIIAAQIAAPVQE
jgi:hypothetical protein